MSSINIENANNFIAHLSSTLKEYKVFTANEVVPQFKKRQEDREPPDHFVDSSFLHIRSYVDDIGQRPFTNVPFWNSPDILLTPIDGLEAYTRELDAGTTYRISCKIWNRGDLVVPSAKVEFFICDPTLGFDTRFASKIGVVAGWVNPYGNTEVTMQYPVPSNLSGHKCLFARTFSFSPVDLPIADFQLDPRLDRHVAQLNLNILAQESSFSFNLVHLPNTIEMITVLPISMDEIIATRHPMLSTHKLSTRQTDNLINKIRIQLLKNDIDTQIEKQVEGAGANIVFHSSKDDSISIMDQRELTRDLESALHSIAEGEYAHDEIKGVFGAFRKMNKEMTQSQFEMDVPSINLRDDEFMALRIVASSRISGKVKGGITLFITG